MGMTPAQTILFNDGEGLTHGDLNSIVQGATQRAWEWPGYADLFGHAQIASTIYATSFDSGTDLYRNVYCRGGGPEMSFSGLTLNISAGFIGVYTDVAPPVNLTPKMAWAYVTGLASVVLSAAPSGQKRFDAITLTMTESSGTPEGRDFKDGVTGALSTTNPNKRKSLTGTLAVTSGSPAVFSLGVTPTTPVTTTYVIALVLVGDTAIEAVYDCTQPFGRQHALLSIPDKDSIVSTGSNWAPGAEGAMLGTIASGKLFVFPPGLRGDCTAKLMGLELKYNLAAGAVVELVAVEPTNIAGATTLRAIQSLLTLGSATTTRLDFRGYPIFQGGGDRFHTYWAHGENIKRGSLSNWGKSLALKITNNGTSDSVSWVRWLFAK